MRIPVLTAAAGAPWEATLVTALEHGSQPITVARRCVDVVDLLAVAAAGQGCAALVAAELRRFDADAVDRLLAVDVIPIAVVAADDAAAEARMRAMGIVHLVPADADPDLVASVVAEATAPPSEPAESARSARLFADPLTAMPAASMLPKTPSGDIPPPTPLRRPGSVIAVWGPTGAPGRTTVALTLADESARLGSAALLIDADVYGGTIAAMLGLLDESPGLASACRVAGTRRLDAAAVSELCWQVRPGLRVLTGIPFAQRWPEVRAAAISAVLAAARTLAQLTVVDCAFALETDEELSYDSLAPRRNGATLAVLEAADVILAVGAADPIGVARLVRGLSELGDAQLAAPVCVVVNKVRRGIAPGDATTELTGALERFAGQRPVALLPYDRDGLDAAAATGRLLGEAKPSSPLRRAVRDLAATLTDATVPSAQHRRRR